MNLTYPRRSSGYRASSSVLSVLLVGTLATLGILALVLMLGAMAAFFPPSFTIKFAMLLGTGVVFFGALLVPATVAPPYVLMRRLFLLLLLVWVVWPMYLSYRGLPGPAINPTRLIYWALAALWFFWIVASPAMRRDLIARFTSAPVFAALLVGYFVWMGVCIPWAEPMIPSLYNAVKTHAGPILVFLVALTCIRTRKDVESALFMILLAALVASSFGLVEAVRKSNVFVEVFPSLLPSASDSAEWLEGLVRDKSRAGYYRTSASFAHPLTFGEYLVLCLPLAAYFLARQHSVIRRLLGAAAIPVILAAIYTTHSRSAMIAAGGILACLITYFGLRMMRQRRHFVSALAGAYALVLLVGGTLSLAGPAAEIAMGRNISENKSTAVRFVMLERGAAKIAKSPVVGYGPGMGAITLGFLPGVSKLTIDNYYLSVALETGVPGLLFFTLLLAFLILRAFRHALKADDATAALAAMLGTALFAFVLVRIALSLTHNLDVVFALFALTVLATSGLLETEGTEPSA